METEDNTTTTTETSTTNANSSNGPTRGNRRMGPVAENTDTESSSRPTAPTDGEMPECAEGETCTPPEMPECEEGDESCEIPAMPSEMQNGTQDTSSEATTTQNTSNNLQPLIYVGVGFGGAIIGAIITYVVMISIMKKHR